MARPKSNEKKHAILAGATKVIAMQGLGASTAMIAKESGVSNGSLFTYFETKSDLLNQLYISLKTEMPMVTMNGIPTDKDLHTQAVFMWTKWLDWATKFPDKRRTLMLLDMSDEITLESRQFARQSMGPIRDLLNNISENGPMNNEPIEFRIMLMNGVAEATITFMTTDPENANKHCMSGFEALWRMIA